MKNALLIIGLVLASCSHTPGKVAESSKTLPPVIVESHCNKFEKSKSPKNFSDFDADKNGHVTRDEYLCEVTKHFQLLDKDHDGFVAGDELKAAGLWKKTADANHDGKVSIIEFMHEAERAFAAADSDGDGMLSNKEFKKARLLP